MHLAQLVHSAGCLADSGNFGDASRVFAEVTWDVLAAVPAQPNQTDIEALVGALSLRCFLDRMAGTPTHEQAIDLFGKAQLVLGDMSNYEWIRHLLCVIAANMGDNHRAALNYPVAEILFKRAVDVAQGTNVAAVAALMHAMAQLQADNRPYARRLLTTQAKQIIVRPTSFAPVVRETGITVLLHAYLGSKAAAARALGLDIHDLDLQHIDEGLQVSLDQNAALVWPTLFVPLYRPI